MSRRHRTVLQATVVVLGSEMRVRLVALSVSTSLRPRSVRVRGKEAQAQVVLQRGVIRLAGQPRAARVPSPAWTSLGSLKLRPPPMSRPLLISQISVQRSPSPRKALGDSPE